MIFKITKQSIGRAIDILKRGGTVVYPTETAYALGADALKERAIAKIFKIKNRSAEKSLPAICYSKKQVKKFFKMPPMAWKIWKKYWPKPVSIILKSKIKSQKSKISIPVRISSNKTARDLARKLGRPIISTSANISGAGAIYDPADIVKSFSNRKFQPDLVLDGGRLPHRMPSTIIKIIKAVDNGSPSTSSGTINTKGPAFNMEIVRQGEAKVSAKFKIEN